MASTRLRRVSTGGRFGRDRRRVERRSTGVEARRAVGRERHELDAMASRAAHEGPRRAPVRRARRRLEAGLAQRRERRVVVGDDDRDVPLGRHDRLVGEQQVHLRRAGLHPCRARGERGAAASTRSKPSSAQKRTHASTSASRTSIATCWITAATVLAAQRRRKRWMPFAMPRATLRRYVARACAARRARCACCPSR